MHLVPLLIVVSQTIVQRYITNFNSKNSISLHETGSVVVDLLESSRVLSCDCMTCLHSKSKDTYKCGFKKHQLAITWLQNFCHTKKITWYDSCSGQLLPNPNQQSMTQSNRHVTLWRKIFWIANFHQALPIPFVLDPVKEQLHLIVSICWLQHLPPKNYNFLYMGRVQG